MGTKDKAKTKAKAKVARKLAKIARKCKRAHGVALAGAIVAAALAGCATSDSAQPAKSQTQVNDIRDCIIVIASSAAVSNGIVTAEGGNVPSLEFITQTQALESSGTESFAQTSTQTPTTDVKPDIDISVPVTKGGAADAVDAAATLVGAAVKGAANAATSPSGGASSAACENCELK